MAAKACITKQPQGLAFFEKYLPVWIILCIIAGILLGRSAPEVSLYLDSLSINVNGVPIVSIPMAIAFFS